MLQKYRRLTLKLCFGPMALNFYFQFFVSASIRHDLNSPTKKTLSFIVLNNIIFDKQKLIFFAIKSDKNAT